MKQVLNINGKRFARITTSNDARWNCHGSFITRIFWKVDSTEIKLGLVINDVISRAA